MNKLRIIFLAFAFLTYHIAATQAPNHAVEVSKMQFMAKQVIPPSPDAAELGKYGNVPISLFTGTPNITVPLMELKGHSLSLPISLSYNASGFKPEDAASWVGSSWSLNAGGVITRSALSNPDNEVNYFGVTNLLTVPDPLNVVPYYTYLDDVRKGLKETRPDMYYYNFNGHSGKFLLRPDLSVIKKERDLKIITPCITSSCPTSKFTIIDEQGITYVFDQIETTTMVVNDEEGQVTYLNYNFVSAWYLTQIISPDLSETIEFEYYSTTNPQVVYQNMLPNKSVSFTYGAKKYRECPLVSFSDLVGTLQTPPTISIKRKFLKKITLKRTGNVVAFVDLISGLGLSQRLDSDYQEDRRLNNLKLYNKVNEIDQLVKQFDFTYGYFGNTSATGPLAFLQKRLRLDNVQEIAVNGTATAPPPYTFTYNSDWSPRFTASLDHWGFYNAAGNTSLVPYVYFAGSNQQGYFFNPMNVGDGANREPTLAGSSATMLIKMQYPTGGYTTFGYELNTAKFNDSVVRSVGGIRVFQIVDHSFNNKIATVKNFNYVLDNGATSGRSGLFPVYSTTSVNTHYENPCLMCGCNDLTEAAGYSLFTLSVSANSVYGLGSFQGSHVGYSQVTESVQDLASGVSLGKTVYKYNIGEYYEYEEDIKSGDLIHQSTYRNDGKLLHETNSSYQYSLNYDLRAVIVKSELQTNRNLYCKIGTNDFHNYGEWENPSPSCIPGTVGNFYTKFYAETYDIIPQNKQLVQQTSKVYDELTDNYLTTTKNFTYGNAAHNYPTLIEEITTAGEKIRTSLKYVADYPTDPGGVNTLANNIYQMKQANIVSIPVEKLQYRVSAAGTNPKYISGQITDHLMGNPSRIYFLESASAITSVTPSNITSGTFTHDSRYRLAASMDYDYNLNLIQQSKTNDAAKSYIWDYNKVYPIAEIAGASSSQVAYTSFETNAKGGFTFSGTPTGTAALTGKRYYSLASGAVSGTTDPTKTYIVSYWRNSNTGPFTVSGSTSHIQGPTKNGWTYYQHNISGVSTTTISGTGNIDEVRLYPLLAQMSTQTFEPLIGITSQCNAASQLLYYDYDGLNRLIHIKDADGNIVKNYKYNYNAAATALTASAQTLFYNAAASTNFTRNNGCPEGAYPPTVPYKVAYGKYTATSQAAADAQAQAEITANGQNLANQTPCFYKNVSKFGWFARQCPPEQGTGTMVKYTVAAGIYSAATQAAADQLAVDDVQANGQANANANGICSCGAEGQKVVNGVCETGTRIEHSSVWENGQWKCTYFYFFSDASMSQYYHTYQATQCSPGT